MKLSARDLVVIEAIRPFFDRDYYLSKDSELANSGVDPIEHFVVLGWKKGQNPTSDFSIPIYLSNNPEVARSGVNPFLHHVILGRHLGRDSKIDSLGQEQLSSITDGDLDSKELLAIRQSFDEEFYLREYPDVAASGFDPVMHYATHGWKEGRDPAPDFSTKAYLSNYPEVAAAAVNPFWHFLAVGREEGRVVTSSSEAAPIDKATENDKDELAPVINTIRDFFDVKFYLRAYPDVADSGFDPIVHYLLHGWKEGRDPTVDFSTQGYLVNNLDVAEAGVNPFWHFIVAGREEGRVSTVLPDFRQSADLAAADERVAYEVASIRDSFDSSYYLAKNPDVAETGVDPVEHFVRYGWKEGRDPSGDFSVPYYLLTNLDVDNAKINPFWHYIVAGKEEGRLARHPGGNKVDRLLQNLPLEEVVSNWRFNKKPTKFLSATDLRKLVLSAAKKMAGKSRLMISISHDNYRSVTGGVQYCVQHEEETATRQGVLYLALHPLVPLPRLAHINEEPDAAVCILLNGKMVGNVRMKGLIEAAKSWRRDFKQTDVVIHHLLGHSPEQVARLVSTLGKERCWLWLHDFFTICPSATLQRNNISFCGAPKQSSNACRVCLYGEERINHRARIEALFRDLSVDVIAPSKFTADYWTERSGLSPASLIIRDHVTIDWIESTIQSPPVSETITVAFVGYPATHKGWPAFEKIVRCYGGKDKRFSFVYLGSSPVSLDHIERIPVSVTAADPDAMIRAIAERGVDIVLHWSTCPETFSFSTFEALAGGAFVLTNPLSGNVAVTVRRLERGAVLTDEVDLLASFDDGRIETMLADARRRKHGLKAVLNRSNMTFDVLQSGTKP